MPQYKYKCADGHFIIVIHPVAECDTARYCTQCGGIMHRVPQEFSVVWGGLPPHLESARPKKLQKFIDTEHERRDKYLADKERYKTKGK